MLTNDGKLYALMREAQVKFDALSPEEKAAHRREQAISWVYGEMRLEGNDAITKEEIAELYDKNHPRTK